MAQCSHLRLVLDLLNLLGPSSYIHFSHPPSDKPPSLPLPDVFLPYSLSLPRSLLKLSLHPYRHLSLRFSLNAVSFLLLKSLPTTFPFPFTFSIHPQSLASSSNPPSIPPALVPPLFINPSIPPSIFFTPYSMLPSLPPPYFQLYHSLLHATLTSSSILSTLSLPTPCNPYFLLDTFNSLTSYSKHPSLPPPYFQLYHSLSSFPPYDQYFLPVA